MIESTTTAAEGTGPCNILIVIDSLGTGGAERCVQDLSAQFVKDGHLVVVLVIRDHIEMQIDHRVVVDVLGFIRYRGLPNYLVNAIRLRKRVSRLEHEFGKFGLILSNLTLSNRLMRLARIGSTQYCIHENLSMSNLAKRRGLSRMLRKRRIIRMLSRSDIIAVSEGIKQDLVANFSVSPASIKTIYNPINVKRIQALAAQTNPYNGEKYIVHVGRLTEQKRPDVLLEAYRQSGVEHRLVQVGQGHLKQSIKTRIQELGLSDRVILAGRLANPYPVIKGADLLVLSSDYEGFGIVLTEALALHTMVVSTDCRSGPREIMSPRFTDYLVPVGDTAALSQKIRQALIDLENKRITIDDTVVERFDIRKISQQYLSLCKRG